MIQSAHQLIASGWKKIDPRECCLCGYKPPPCLPQPSTERECYVMASEQMPQLPAIRSIGGTENNLVDTSLSATAGASEVRIGPRLRRRLRSEPPFELTPQNDPRQLSMLAYWQGMSTA